VVEEGSAQQAAVRCPHTWHRRAFSSWVVAISGCIASSRVAMPTWHQRCTQPDTGHVHKACPLFSLSSSSSPSPPPHPNHHHYLPITHKQA
jgi:hypothetical protein